ncbi:ubiquitin carboxyl-terminal hydrolase 4 [Moniliophthora roreri MCA 2997]|nr:ubiquitin carboxyl-terminal hydrolase 4 [Moniliophthora roreri MCA 2997]
MIRPSPAAVATPPALERQDNRPRLPTSQGQRKVPTPSRIESYWPMPYWADSRIGIWESRNFGNAPMQCLSGSPLFTRSFNELVSKLILVSTCTLLAERKISTMASDLESNETSRVVHALRQSW